MNIKENLATVFGVKDNSEFVRILAEMSNEVLQYLASNNVSYTSSIEKALLIENRRLTSLGKLSADISIDDINKLLTDTKKINAMIEDLILDRAKANFERYKEEQLCRQKIK